MVRMHCHNELLKDLGYNGCLPDETLWKWFNDRYSTSKHLLTLYSAGVGIGAKNILEVGFGRSSFVLAKVAQKNGGIFHSCDTRDFSNLFNEEEKQVTKFHIGHSSNVWKETPDKTFDFIFLDYFSGEGYRQKFISSELNQALRCLKDEGLLMIHDVYTNKFLVGKYLRKKSSGLCGKKIHYSFLPYGYGLGIIMKKKREWSYSDLYIKKEDTL